MKQADLVKAVATATNLPKNAIKDILETAGDFMAIELVNGGSVPLPGLGKLHAENRAARRRRNPRTGEQVDVPAKRVAKFRASGVLKAAMAGN